MVHYFSWMMSSEVFCLITKLQSEQQTHQCHKYKMKVPLGHDSSLHRMFQPKISDELLDVRIGCRIVPCDRTTSAGVMSAAWECSIECPPRSWCTPPSLHCRTSSEPPRISDEEGRLSRHWWRPASPKYWCATIFEMLTTVPVSSVTLTGLPNPSWTHPWREWLLAPSCGGPPLAWMEAESSLWDQCCHEHHHAQQSVPITCCDDGFASSVGEQTGLWDAFSAGAPLWTVECWTASLWTGSPGWVSDRTSRSWWSSWDTGENWWSSGHAVGPVLEYLHGSASHLSRCAAWHLAFLTELRLVAVALWTPEVKWPIQRGDKWTGRLAGWPQKQILSYGLVHRDMEISVLNDDGDCPLLASDGGSDKYLSFHLEVRHNHVLVQCG